MSKVNKAFSEDPNQAGKLSVITYESILQSRIFFVDSFSKLRPGVGALDSR